MESSGRDDDRFLELKGAAEALLEALGIDSPRTAAYHDLCWKRGTGASLEASDRRLGHLGEVAPSFRAALGLDRPAWAAVFDVAALAELSKGQRRYQAIPRYPAAKRDLAIVVPSDLPHAELEHAIRESGGALLAQVRLFDVFEGSSIGAGRKSMAYALEFRSPERTLEDREADKAIGAIVRALEAKFGAVVRGAPVPTGSGE